MEPSEVMASVAMLMKPADLTKYSKDMSGLVQFLKVGKKIAGSSKVVYGAGLKQKALGVFNPTDKKNLAAVVQGISAAMSISCLLYTSPSPRDRQKSRMPSSA